MKNITFSAEEALIEAARERARHERTTLNDEFRRWLAGYARTEDRVRAAAETIAKLQAYVRTEGRKFTREELNER
jgi:chromosomal replication initiation ATPase DnaA